MENFQQLLHPGNKVEDILGLQVGIQDHLEHIQELQALDQTMEMETQDIR